MSENDEFRLIQREEIYQGKIVTLTVDRLEIEGRETIREVVRHPGGVVVIAQMVDGRIPFVRQHRYPLNKAILELPAGKIDEGEEPEASARREFEEETGLRANSFEKMGEFYSSPGFCDELLHLYYATGLEVSETNRELDEVMQLEYYGLEEAIRMAERRELVDAKSVAAVFWLARRPHV